MNKALEKAMATRQRGVLAARWTINALIATPQGMRGIEVAHAMRPDTPGRHVGKGMVHAERASMMAGGNWDETFTRRVSAANPRWYAGPGARASVEALDRYLDAAGEHGGIPLGAVEDRAVHAAPGALSLEGFETVRGTEDIATTIETMAGLAQRRGQTPQAASAGTVNGIYACGLGPTARKGLPRDARSDGRWSGLLAIEACCAHGARAWQRGDPGKAHIAWTRRVRRVVEANNPIGQLVRTRSETEVGWNTGWRAIGPWTVHLDRVFATHGGPRDVRGFHPAPPGGNAWRWWTVTCTDAEGREGTRAACLLRDELPSNRVLHEHGVLTPAERMLTMVALHDEDTGTPAGSARSLALAALINTAAEFAAGAEDGAAALARLRIEAETLEGEICTMIETARARSDTASEGEIAARVRAHIARAVE